MNSDYAKTWHQEVSHKLKNSRKKSYNADHT